jgi:hypothetical protein
VIGLGATDTIPAEEAPAIHEVRGQLVVLDDDVARLFGITTKRLNEQVKRNRERFEGFAFQLTAEEFADVRSQSVLASHGGRRTPPWAFSEHGVVMAATVLRSDRATVAARLIVNVFVAARRTMIAVGKGQNLPARLDARDLLPIGTERRNGLVEKIDRALGRVLDAIVDPVAETTVREEARTLVSEGLGAIKAQLAAKGIENERTLAEIHKLLREAEAIEVEIEAKRTENEHRRLAYVAKQLRIVLEVQRYMESGQVEGLLTVLKDLGG